MARVEPELPDMTMSDLSALRETCKSLKERYEKKGVKKAAEKWAYREALCVNALESRATNYFEDI